MPSRRSSVPPICLGRCSNLSDSYNSTSLGSLTTLTQPSGQLKKCQTELQEILHKLGRGWVRGEMKSVGMRSLKWPFEKGDPAPEGDVHFAYKYEQFV